MARIGVGLIGAGKHGQRYLNHIRADVPKLALVALSRQNVIAGREQAATLGCRFHEDWRALIADPAVEAVIVVVPPNLHPAVVTAVATARKALLIEKPLAITSAAVHEIVRIVRATGVPTLMAHTLRWNTVVQAVRRELVTLGPLQALQVNQRFEPSSLAWLDDPALSGGGIILHTGVHSFDLVRCLTGCEVARVWCRTARSHTRRTEDNFAAIFELAGSNALVTASGSRSTAGRSGLIDVAGAEGQIVGDHALGAAYRVRGLTRTEVALPDPVPTVREALRAFVTLLTSRTPPPVSIEDGARAVLIAEACLRAASSGGAETVEDLRA